LRKSAGARHGKKSDKEDEKAHEEKGQVGISKKRRALPIAAPFVVPLLISSELCALRTLCGEFLFSTKLSVLCVSALASSSLLPTASVLAAPYPRNTHRAS
jgi:hypothetical protein